VKTVTLYTQDNYPIVATVFEPTISKQKLLLVNTATGVKQQTYYNFASFFAENGFTVITYDYRGISLSKPNHLKGFPASMKIWGNTDYKAITDYIKTQYPDHEKFLIGHSVGALILGMNADSKIFKKFCFVATQNTYHGHLPLKVQLMSWFGFGLYQPIITRLKGYFETRIVNLGESLPTGVSKDWRTLIMHPKSVNKLLEQTPNHSAELTQEVLYLHMEDDDWITDKGMQKLMKETFFNMKPTYRTIRVKESTGEPIGHINFFRSKHQKLWNIVLDWFS